jgi:putative ubiquitin-RnfH superfamily antitoxin RatB of RatAB toxin-antitoxin module
MADDSIQVEVAYALPDRQAIVSLEMSADSSVRQAIEASGILQQFPDIDLSKQKVGIFGRICPLTAPLSAADRVEIYRPLRQDPMQARRDRLSDAK